MHVITGYVNRAKTMIIGCFSIKQCKSIVIQNNKPIFAQ